MKITFLGAAHEVTGSCTLIEACGKRILVDCGMEQGADIYENYDLPVSPGEIDAVLLTHAHIDHSGKLPAMAREALPGPPPPPGTVPTIPSAIVTPGSLHPWAMLSSSLSQGPGTCQALFVGGPSPFFTWSIFSILFSLHVLSSLSARTTVLTR